MEENFADRYTVECADTQDILWLSNEQMAVEWGGMV